MELEPHPVFTDPSITMELEPHPVFTDPSIINGKSDKELCAIGLCAWAASHMGVVPDNFGDVMVQIADKLKITGSPRSFSELGKMLVAETPPSP